MLYALGVGDAFGMNLQGTKKNSNSPGLCVVLCRIPRRHVGKAWVDCPTVDLNTVDTVLRWLNVWIYFVLDLSRLDGGMVEGRMKSGVWTTHDCRNTHRTCSNG